MNTRKFYLDTDWQYLKIYCGIKTADIILKESITPLVSQLKEENLIKKWFFIRYNDPKPHIRLRFQLSDVSNYNEISAMQNFAFIPYINSGEIANIAIDSYVRELERYGENTMGFAEELFCKSSELTLKFLDFDDEERLIVSMYYFENLLSELKLSAAQKMDWIHQSSNAFKKEFNADKRLNSQLNKKFIEFESKYNAFFESAEFEEIRNLIIASILESKSALKKLREYDSNFLVSFFCDIFHMHINRTFISSQRLFEMVLYDYLFRKIKALSKNNQV